jgi:hypothetical protein
MESDESIVINLSLVRENYPTNEFERLEEEEQSKQSKILTELLEISKEIQQMEDALGQY